MGKKSALTAEQRTQLVLRLLSKEEPAAQIARRAGVSEQTLYRWREEFIGAGRQASMEIPTFGSLITACSSRRQAPTK